MAPKNDIVDRLRADCAGLTVPQLTELAQAMGIPAGTLIKVTRGETLDPRWSFVRKVIAHYQSIPASVALRKPGRRGGPERRRALP